MAAGWIAAIAAIAGVAMSGYEYASMPKPGNPNLAGATRAGTEAEAATLADRRRMEAAAQQGTSTLRFGYSAQPFTAEMQARLAENIAHLQQQSQKLRDKGGYDQWRQADAIDKKLELLRAQYGAIPEGGGTIYLDKHHRPVPKEEAFADFTGYGEADVQGKIAKQNAQNVLDLEKKYGPQFIEEALKQQELSDPEGTAARRKSFELIKQLEDEHPDRPVAELLDSQITDQLHAGKNLDRISSSVLDDAVAKASAARGGSAEGLDFAEPLTTGAEGESRRMAAQRKAASWLASGQTPEDVEYRREHAIEGDLGAFINGRTPESQFATLSGAQQGPAPFYQGRPLPGANQSTGSAAGNAALGVWGKQLAFNESQASPWMAGLSMLLKGVNAYTSTVPRTQ